MLSFRDRLLLFEGVSSGVTYTFTSATSSTSSSYTVTLTSLAGQTIPLTMNGVSQGNMVESPAGTYSKAVTLDSLTNTFSVDGTTFDVAFNLDTVGLVSGYYFNELAGAQTFADFHGSNDLTNGSSVAVATDDLTANGEFVTGDGVNDYAISTSPSGLPSGNDDFTFIVVAKSNLADTGAVKTFFHVGNTAATRASAFFAFLPGGTQFRYGIFGDDLNETLTYGTDWRMYAVRYRGSDRLLEGRSYSVGWGSKTLGGDMALVGNQLGVMKNLAGTSYSDASVAYALIYDARKTNEADLFEWLKAHAKANKPTLFASLP